jgi:hypothetical protein
MTLLVMRGEPLRQKIPPPALDASFSIIRLLRAVGDALQEKIPPPNLAALFFDMTLPTIAGEEEGAQ